MNPTCYLLLIVFAIFVCTQGAIAAKSSPEVVDPVYGGADYDILNKIQSELVNALDQLQNYQESAMTPLKLAEKRRNKFEFIRFGRRRR